MNPKHPSTTRARPELGQVHWLRNHDQALARARDLGRPVLLLFQEVPGCSTCVNFGHDALSHPLTVELIEEHFVPLAIFNNHPGHDAEILRRYGEASWNNSVVHFLRPDGSALLQRLANRYDALALHDKIVAALQALGHEVPGYAQALRADLRVQAGLSATATYETPCFWSGEISLAQHPAVLTTEAGWVDGEEVVRVQFDPEEVERAALDAYARDQGFAVSRAKGFGVDEAPQYYLSRSKWRFLPLSPAQRTRINLALPYRGDVHHVLSPSQLRWAQREDLERIGRAQAYRGDMRAEWDHLQARTAAASGA